MLTRVAVADCDAVFSLDRGDAEIFGGIFGFRPATTSGGNSDLQSLNLDSTRVTDAGLHHLESLKALKDLNLINTRVTAVGVDKLGNRCQPAGLGSALDFLFVERRGSKRIALMSTLACR
jgi:hypothetical protein